MDGLTVIFDMEGVTTKMMWRPGKSFVKFYISIVVKYSLQFLLVSFMFCMSTCSAIAGKNMLINDFELKSLDFMIEFRSLRGQGMAFVYVSHTEKVKWSIGYLLILHIWCHTSEFGTQCQNFYTSSKVNLMLIYMARLVFQNKVVCVA